MYRYKFKYQVVILFLGFSLFYTRAADKDVLGKTQTNHTYTAAKFVDEDVNEKQIADILHQVNDLCPNEWLLLIEIFQISKKHDYLNLSNQVKNLILSIKYENVDLHNIVKRRLNQI